MLIISAILDCHFDFQNVSCFVFEQSIMFHKAAVQNIYNVYDFKTLSTCIFDAVKKQSGIVFIVDAMFGNSAYIHNLYTVVEQYWYILFLIDNMCDND